MLLQMCSTRLAEREQVEGQRNWPSSSTTTTKDIGDQDSDEEGSVELECRENMDENEEAFDSSEDEEEIMRKAFPQQRVSPGISGFSRRSLTPDVGKIKYSPIPFTRRARTPEVSSSLAGSSTLAKTKQQRQPHKVVEPTFRTPKVDDKELNTFTRPLPASSVKSSSPGLTISGTFTPKGSVFRPKRHIAKSSGSGSSPHTKPVHPSLGQQLSRLIPENIQQHTTDTANISHNDGMHTHPQLSPQNSPTKSPLKHIAPFPYTRPPKAGLVKPYAASTALQGIAQHLPMGIEGHPLVLPKGAASEGTAVIPTSFVYPAVATPVFRPLVSPPLAPLAVTTTTYHFSSPVISLGKPVVTSSPKSVPQIVSPVARVNEISVIQSKPKMTVEQVEGDASTDSNGDKILKRYINDGMEA